MPGPTIVRTYAGADSRSAATTVPINLDVAPTAGNVLVTWCAWDKSVGSWTVPSGFTLVTSVVGTSTSGALAYKVSDGTETLVTWTGSTGGSGQVAWLAELTPCTLGAYTSPTYSDTSVTSISTGTASSDTGLALAFMTSDTGTNVDGSPTWSNGFTAMPDADYKTDAGGGTYTYNGGVWLIGGDPAMGVASKVITAEAAQTTYSCTDTGDQMWAMVAVFRLTITGTGAIAVPAPTVAGSGTETFTATGAISAGTPTVSGTGAETFTATGTITAPAPTVAGSGTHTEGVAGSGTITVPAGTVSGTGTLTITGSGAIAAPAATVAGTGAETMAGTGAIVGRPPSVTGTGVLTITATGAISVSPPTVSGSGTYTGDVITPVPGRGTLTAAARGAALSVTVRSATVTSAARAATLTEDP